MATNKRTFLQGIWDFFCSLKLSITLLILLAVTSIIGTVIPQAPPREYLEQISPAKIKIYSTLGFFDMYHSWWFILLLYLLTVNLVACSIKRLPRVWKMISEPNLVMDAGLEKSLSLTHEFKMGGDVETLKEKMAAFLRANFAAPVITEVNGEYHLFAQKMPYCRLGVYVVHFSIIIVFIGAMIGSFFGFKGFTNIVEGSSVSQAFNPRTEKAIDLGFALKCEKFSVSFYDTGAPKEFKSILTVLENGQPVPGYINIPVIVNSPLTYKGITFYQASYGPAGEGAVHHLTVRNKLGGTPQPLAVRQGESAPLPGGGFIRVLEAVPEVKMFMPQLSGAAAKVEIVTPGGAPQQFVLFQKYPKFDEHRGGDLVFTYDGSEEKYYTGLQVAKDPGVWVVWLGCSLMVAGICLAFFFSHKRVWIRVGHGRVVLGGTASKNPSGFQLLFDDLVGKLKKTQKESV